MGGRPLASEVSKRWWTRSRSLFLTFPRFHEQDFLAHQRQEMAAGQFVADVAEIHQVHALAGPAGAAFDRVGRAHAGLADHGVDALFVGLSGDGVRRPLPRGAAETKRVEQGGRAAGVSGDGELVGGNRLEIRRVPHGWGCHRHSATHGQKAISKQPEHRIRHDGRWMAWHR